MTGPVRARQLVDSLKAAGADMIKMYRFGSRDLYLAVAAAARRAKIPFGGHLAAGTLTPLEALQTATLNPAKFLHATDSLGTVATGKLADVVLPDADPLAHITNTQQIRAVVANGRYYDRAALDAQLLTTPRALGSLASDWQKFSDLGMQYEPHPPVILKP